MPVTQKRLFDKLAAIAATFPEQSYDTEVDHARADGILVEMLRIFAKQSGGEIEPLVNGLLDKYEQMEKWYA